MEGTDEADEEKNRHTLTWQDLDRENTVTTPVELDSGLRTGTFALSCTDDKRIHMERHNVTNQETAQDIGSESSVSATSLESPGSKNAPLLVGVPQLNTAVESESKELSVKAYADAQKLADQTLPDEGTSHTSQGHDSGNTGNADTSEGPNSHLVESDVSVFETLVSDVMALMLQCQSLHIAGVDTISKLSSGLKALQAYFKQASRQLKGKLADSVIQPPGMLGTIWDFSSDIYQSMFVIPTVAISICVEF